MRNDGRLGAALRRAAGELPDNRNPLEQVTIRARRQRRVRIAGVAAAVLVIAAGVPLIALGVGDVDDGPATVVADGAQAAPECPEPSGGPGDPAASGDGLFVPDGVLAARLCGVPRPDLEMPAPDTEATKHTLFRAEGDDLDALVNVLNKLPQVDPATLDCTDDLGPTYDLVLTYPDSEVVVTFEAFGCRTVALDGDHRLGGRQLLATYEKLVATKQQSSPSPTLSCEAPSTSEDTGIQGESFVAEGATLARLCPSAPGTEDDPHTAITIRLTGDQIVRTLNGLPKPTEPGACEEAIPEYQLSLGYGNGDYWLIGLANNGCVSAYHQRVDETGTTSWTEYRTGGENILDQVKNAANSQSPSTSDSN